MKFHQFISLFSIIIAITACASGPVKNQVQTIDSEPQIVPLDSEVSSSFSQIMQDYQRTQDEQRLQQALVNLAIDYQDQGDCHSASTVIKYSLPILSEPRLHAIGNIIRSECAIIQLRSDDAHLVLENESDLLNTQESEVLTKLLDRWLIQNTSISFDSEWQARQELVHAFYLGSKNEVQQAIDKSFRTNSETSPLNAIIPQLQFTWLSQLPESERLQQSYLYPRLNSYQQMLSVIEAENLTDAERQSALRRLIANNDKDMNLAPLPQQVELLLRLNLNPQQKFAVLLPLSGRLAAQGEAIKQGMLASYFEQIQNFQRADNNELGAIDTETSLGFTLVFLDTGSENQLSDAINQEAMQDYSGVIGPLLKPHVQQISTFLPPEALRIYLNQSDDEQLASASDTDLAPSDYALVNFFALSPEQEAQELAQKMLAQNIKHPVLIYDNSSLSERMAEAYLEVWNGAMSSETIITPSEVKYTDNKSMRAGITSALDVLQSQQRINQLSSLVNETVHSVTRNRRDVDAFVVFARPNEVELINPIIESSMSLFTDEQIPVYASSLSYNHKQNKNTIRDLRNLVFMDMPFLLPKGRETALAKELDSLQNAPSSTYLRLFAFGYDAIALSQHALKLRLFDNTRLNGLSGELSINFNGEVNRQLDTLAISTGN